ncbi:MFS transporter, partial [Burkholderia cenocepacia]|nr:MFS transporter [Burkholderia cenocepacia]
MTSGIGTIERSTSGTRRATAQRRRPPDFRPTDFAMSREPTHSALLWIVAAAFFMQSLDTTIVNTALPSIAQSLQASPLA